MSALFDLPTGLSAAAGPRPTGLDTSDTSWALTQPQLYRSEAFAEDVTDELAPPAVSNRQDRWTTVDALASWPLADTARVHAAAARVLALTSALMGLRRC